MEYSLALDNTLDNVITVQVNVAGDIDWEDEDAVVHDLTCVAITGIQDPVRAGKCLRN